MASLHELLQVCNVILDSLECLQYVTVGVPSGPPAPLIHQCDPIGYCASMLSRPALTISTETIDLATRHARKNLLDARYLRTKKQTGDPSRSIRCHSRSSDLLQTCQLNGCNLVTFMHRIAPVDFARVTYLSTSEITGTPDSILNTRALRGKHHHEYVPRWALKTQQQHSFMMLVLCPLHAFSQHTL